MSVLFPHEDSFQVMFLSTLLGTGESWTMMKTMRVIKYINYEAGILTQFCLNLTLDCNESSSLFALPKFGCM